METFNSFNPEILCKSFLVSCTGFNLYHIEVSFHDVQYFDSDDMMSPASMKCLHQEREANVQCLPLAGRERPVSLCVSCQDPWDENNSEMRSYSVYNIIQHVTSSLVVTTRHKIFSLDHQSQRWSPGHIIPISILPYYFSQFQDWKYLSVCPQ